MLTHQQAEELISDQLDGPLDVASQAALSAHLSGCASCGYFAAQMGIMGEGLRELPRLPASPTVARQVRERIAQPATIWDRLGQMLAGQLGVAPVAATAALLVAVVAGALLLDRDGDGTADNPTVLASTQISIDRTLTSTRATGEPTATPVPGVVLPTETPETPPLPNIRFEPPAAATETPVPAATETPVPDATETPVPTVAPSETPVPEATETAVPTNVPTSTATEVPPTATEVPPTATPTDEPTEIPTVTEIPPTETATRVPTEEPTETPTEEPTEVPTSTPTDEPTEEPDTATPEPTVQGAPTIGPMDGDPDDPEPIADPDETPGEQPTDEPVAGDPTETPGGDGQDNELIIEPTDGTGAVGDDPVETPEEDVDGPAEGTGTEDIPGDETPEDDADQRPGAVLDETSRIVGLPEGSSAPIGELAFSPDGRLMVVSGASGLDLRVVDRTTGGELVQLGAGAHPLWSPGSGALLFQDVGGDAGTVSLYWTPDSSIFSISDPSEASATDVPAGWVGATAYYLRTYDTGRIELRAWDAGSGVSLGPVWGADDAQLTGARPLQTNAGFLIPTPDAWLLVTPEGLAQEVGGNPFGFVGDGRLSPDGSLLAIATGDGLVIVDAGSPSSVVATLPYSETVGAGFSWSPDGTSLAVSDGASIAVYTPGGDLVGTATSETGVTVAGLQFQPDGIYFVQTSGEPSLRRFDPNRLRP